MKVPRCPRLPNTITLYDIPGNASKKVAWSPNVWKARYALNIKRLPYRTAWVEYPDIEPLCKRIGASPTYTPGNGPYTLPVIHDPSTGAAISNSIDIVAYLDATYPSTRPLIPTGTRALHTMASDIFHEKVRMKLILALIKPGVAQMNERSRDYFVRSREGMYGVKINDLVPEGEPRDALWKELEKGMGEFKGWLEKAGGGEFFMGKDPTYADLVLASSLTCLRRILGEESEEWKVISAWHGGRWKRFMDAFVEWDVVDAEGLTYKSS